MSRKMVLLLAGFVALTTGCSQESAGTKSAGTKASVSELPKDLTSTAATVALSQPQFTAPIALLVPPDQVAIAAMLDRFNGPQDENMLNSHSILNSCRPGYMPTLSIQNYPASSQSNALVGFTQTGYGSVKYYTVSVVRNGMTGSNSDGSPHIESYPVEPRSYQCFVLSKKIAPYLGANYHSGGTIVLGKRVLSNWTYQNTYQTNVSGKGSVNVFAGTFNYSVSSMFPDVSFSGVGTVAIKMWIDPDNGRWVVEQWEDQNPPAIAFGKAG